MISSNNNNFNYASAFALRIESSHSLASMGEEQVRHSVCRFCNKRYLFRGNLLEVHERIHRNEKPFPCKICGNKPFSKGEYHNCNSPILLKPWGIQVYVSIWRLSCKLANKIYFHYLKKTLRIELFFRFFWNYGKLKSTWNLRLEFRAFCDILSRFRVTAILSNFSEENAFFSPVNSSLWKALFETIYLLTRHKEKPYAWSMCDKRYSRGDRLNHHIQFHHHDGVWSTISCLSWLFIRDEVWIGVLWP